jgi:hypothetical protein
MASKFVSYFSGGLSNLRLHVRNMASTARPAEAYYTVGGGSSLPSGTYTWPDSKLGPFAQVDGRFPMPGRVGLAGSRPSTDSNAATHVRQRVERDQRISNVMKVLANASPANRQAEVLSQVGTMLTEYDDYPVFEPAAAAAASAATATATSACAPAASALPSDSVERSVECWTQECGAALRRQLQPLFPEKHLAELSSLTSIVLSQQTVNDMATWSSAVAEEREALMQNFVETSRAICERLHEAGFWADFIDPASGMPFFGARTSTTLFETDELMERMCNNLSIDELGCCRVLRHARFGSHAFSGCLFTDAPASSPLLAQLTQRAN